MSLMTQAHEIPQSSADTCAAFTPSLRAHVSVVLGKRVPVDAMRRPGMRTAWPIATKVVDLLSNRLQVVWPNTVPYAAQVVDGEATWNRGDAELVSPAMGVGLISCAIGKASNAEAAVAVREALSRPQPTGVGEFHLRPKADSGINGFGAKASCHSSIVAPIPVT